MEIHLHHVLELLLRKGDRMKFIRIWLALCVVALLLMTMYFVIHQDHKVAVVAIAVASIMAAMLLVTKHEHS